MNQPTSKTKYTSPTHYISQ